MATLTTDFIKIAQVGPSIDGRFIREDWLRDMAETYARETYTAMLWPEHVRWFGNLGEVLELRDGPDEKGVYCLFARFAPNKRMLEYNAEGQGLFYSIEVEENFADTGKTYLAGLGVTDSPASLGMQSTRFSAGKKTVFIGNVPFTPPAPVDPQKNGKQPGAEEVEGVPHWFKRKFPFLFTSDGGEEAPAQKESGMDELEARLAVLEETVTAMQEQLAALDARVATLEVDVAASGDGESSSGDPAYKALARQLGSFRKEMTEFKSLMSAVVKSGTKAPPTTGAAGGKRLL